MLPTIYFYRSPTASYIFLAFIIGISAWNGANYYIEVFARRFEKELERMRSDLEAQAGNGESSHEDDQQQVPPPEPAQKLSVQDVASQTVPGSMKHA